MGKFRDGMAVTGEAVSLVLAAIDRIKTILDGLEKLQHEPAGDDADVIGKLNRAAARAWNPRWQDDRPAASERIADEVVFESANAGAPRSLAESGEGAGSVASQSIRASIDTLDQLMTMVSELVLTRNQLLEVLRRHDDCEFSVPLQRLSVVTTQAGRDQQSDFRSGFFDRIGSHQHFRPRRRHGYRTQQYRADWRNRRCGVGSRQRHELRYQNSADASDCRRSDRRDSRRTFRFPTARSPRACSA